MQNFKLIKGQFINTTQDALRFFPFLKTMKIEDGEICCDDNLKIISGKFIGDRRKRGMIKNAKIVGGSFENIDFEKCELSYNDTQRKNCRIIWNIS
jgi:hypothetical protein